MAGAPAIMSEKPRAPVVRFLRRVTSPDRSLTFKALRIDTAIRSGLAGFTKKSTAPARIAFTTVSMPP